MVRECDRGKWFSNIPVISIKTGKEDYEKFPMGRTVPFVIPPERPVFPYKWKALIVLNDGLAITGVRASESVIIKRNIQLPVALRGSRTSVGKYYGNLMLYQKLQNFFVINRSLKVLLRFVVTDYHPSVLRLSMSVSGHRWTGLE